MDRNKEVRKKQYISPLLPGEKHNYSRTKARVLGYIHSDTKIVRNILQP